ncbi:MAG: PBP1A family penicillin-binding protein [bacterium]|nr:PBP1A family penicillin-binding protein [bacterium]
MTTPSVPHIGLTETLVRIFKLVFGVTFFVVAGAFFFSVFIYFHFLRGLPQIANLSDYNPPVVSEVFAEDGTKIGEFWEERRFLLPYEEIPKQVINAFVASEDERFWEHGGIDPRSILRAFLKNLRAGKIVQGGSTITQQVTRSLLLTRAKSLDRKIKEALLATQLEKNFSKEQILYLYLNQIFLGNRSYGIESAARNYFHKQAKDLSLAEVTLIAGLPSAPSQYSPLVSPRHAKEQQRRVLSRMVANGLINQEEAHKAFLQKLEVFEAKTDKEFNNRYAPYFVENVRRLLQEKYGNDLLYREGLKITTTADIRANLAANSAIRTGLHSVNQRQEFAGPIKTVPPEEMEKTMNELNDEIIHEKFSNRFLTADGKLLLPPEASLISFETDRLYKALVTAVTAEGLQIRVGHRRGFIVPQDVQWAHYIFHPGDLVWVQKKNRNISDASFVLNQEPVVEGALFSFEPASGKIRAIVGGYDFAKSEFNRATQGLRQPGSAFKPIVYAAALDKGYKPGTAIDDGPVTFQVSETEYYSPRNYGSKYKGTLTLRSALTASVNIIAVKVLYDIGIDYMAAYGYKLGMTSPIQRYISSALGSSAMTLEELTKIYGAFANGGIRPHPFMILKIVDKDGNVVEEQAPTKALAESVADFNLPLLTEQAPILQTHELKISEEEKKILYGSAVPPGHVISPQTAYLMTNMLTDVIQKGTGRQASALNRPAAGKTGTTNEETDCWFIGYTPDLIAGVWVGYDNQKKLGKKMTGGVVAAPIWLDYMQEILRGKPIASFIPPPGMDLAKLDELSGGSAIFSTKEISDVVDSSEKIMGEGDNPSTRGIEFLYSN